MRNDFFYRIQVIQIELPPLRHRKQDIPLLAEHFLREMKKSFAIPKIPGNTMDIFMEYDRLGNVREQRNVLQLGNLNDQKMILKILEDLSDKGLLTDCQPGLIRILRYKGNWRVGEEALKRVAEIKNPSSELVFQVLATLADDNIYFDVMLSPE